MLLCVLCLLRPEPGLLHFLLPGFFLSVPELSVPAGLLLPVFVLLPDAFLRLLSEPVCLPDFLLPFSGPVPLLFARSGLQSLQFLLFSALLLRIFISSF